MNGIALMPDRSSTGWWHFATKKCDRLLMVQKKIKFYRADGTVGESPSNGTTLFASGYEGVNSLYRAQKNGLGIVLKK